MRQRRGFISNSSSSSFIISTPKEQETINLTLEVNLEKHGEKIETVEQLEYYIRENYYSKVNESFDDIIKDNEDAKETYEKCLKAIKSGETVWILTASSEDIEDTASIVMYENSLRDLQVNANIIQE